MIVMTANDGSVGSAFVVARSKYMIAETKSYKSYYVLVTNTHVVKAESKINLLTNQLEFIGTAAGSSRHQDRQPMFNDLALLVIEKDNVEGGKTHTRSTDRRFAQRKDGYSRERF